MPAKPIQPVEPIHPVEVIEVELPYFDPSKVAIPTETQTSSHPDPHYYHYQQPLFVQQALQPQPH